ncbi:MAG TPA: ABC transporter permease, partial [Patescibacteria group bacterium]|nr:ABC transporter permease [Patescibacteria group bacterium]
PFSAVYYPLYVLPDWVQKIAHMLPMTYVFEGMRMVILNGTFSWDYIMKSAVLSLFYLTLAILLFLFVCEKSREKGYARLE